MKLIITSMPTPYRLSVFAEAYKLDPSIHVIFLARSEANRNWDIPFHLYDFSFEILEAKQIFIKKYDFALQYNPGLIKRIRVLSPARILLGGYNSFSYILLLIYCKIFNIDIGIWWGSHSLSERISRGFVKKVKDFIVRSFDFYFCYGTKSEEFLLNIGINRDSIFVGRNSVDVDLFGKASLDYKLRPNISEVQFLYVGQIIERKGIFEMISALSLISFDKWRLTIIGHGDMVPELLKKISHLGLGGNVAYGGYTTQIDETISFYEKSDVLLMPSTIEVWGLVVNEALACGMPVLASKYAGVTYDLIDSADVFVGGSVDFTDVEHSKAVIEDLIDSIHNRSIDYSAIKEWGMRFTPHENALVLVKSLQ